MPPPRTPAPTLSEQEIHELREDVAAGREVPVWFTATAVGVPVGGSAKLLAVADPPVGEFLKVRPAGSRDELYCSPGEITRTRPARRRAAPTGGTSAKADPASTAAGPARPSAAAAAPADTVATDTVSGTVPRTTPTRTAATADGASTVATDGPRPRSRSRSVAAATASKETSQVPAASPAQSGRKRKESPEITVVLHSGADGEWSVTVTHGKRTAVKATPVGPGEVATAARALPPAVLEAVDAALTAARARQEERVAALRSELAAAEQALSELTG